MSICLCSASAEKILDLIALKRLKPLGNTGCGVLDSCRAGKRDIKVSVSQLPELEEPIHVLVRDGRLRVDSSFSKAHLWRGAVPPGSLMLVAPGAHVICPEFNALLEMHGRSLVERALVLMGYCGIFAIDESSEDGFIKRPQLTTVDKLNRYAARMGNHLLVNSLHDTLPFVLERARSPFEARLVLALTLPSKMGGLGFEHPKLNHPIRLGRNAQAIQGTSVVDGDLVWQESRIAIEANGRLRHEGKFGDDLTRASALESEGYTVRFVTTQQMRSARQMLLLGQWLAERLGIEPVFPERRVLQELLNEINGFQYHRFSL